MVSFPLNIICVFWLVSLFNDKEGLVVLHRIFGDNISALSPYGEASVLRQLSLFLLFFFFLVSWVFNHSLGLFSVPPIVGRPQFQIFPRFPAHGGEENHQGIWFLA